MAPINVQERAAADGANIKARSTAKGLEAIEAELKRKRESKSKSKADSDDSDEGAGKQWTTEQTRT